MHEEGTVRPDSAGGPARGTKYWCSWNIVVLVSILGHFRDGGIRVTQMEQGTTAKQGAVASQIAGLSSKWQQP